MLRPRIPGPSSHQMMHPQQAPPFPQFGQQNHPANHLRLPMHPNPSLPAQPQSMNIIRANQVQPLPLPLPLPMSGPRKVLINPNFKGGVQAATSEYITSINIFQLETQSLLIF